MNEFVQMILQELRQSLGAAVAVCLLAVMGVAAYYAYYRRKNGAQAKFPWLRVLLILALVGYLAMVDYATIGRLSGGFRAVNFHLFRAWREAWNQYSVKSWLNLLLNIAMFVPLGILVPLIWKPMRKFLRMFPLGFGVSAFFEISQYLTGRGILDVDDLFANSLGAMIGFFLVMAVLSLFREKGKRLRPTLLYSSLAVLPLLAIGGMFLGYELQPYGNLAIAPAFRADTGKIEFHLECTLPESRDSAPVYRAEPLDRAACQSFADRFAAIVRADFHEILYYDKETYFIDRGQGENGAHFLILSCLDGSYRYNHVLTRYDAPDVSWEETDRETLEELLSAFSITVPTEAEFTPEEQGWHSFRVHALRQGELLLDGTLRCRFGSGQLWDLENRLVAYTYDQDVPVISPEEAFRELKSGWFAGGDLFDRIAPEDISVFSCELTYLIDSKGFYQPVYRFSLTGDNYQNTVYIPALA